MKSYREREHTPEQQERIENDPLSTELKRYRREHNLTVDSLSSFFEEKDIKGLGASTIKKYEAGSGKPSWETTVLIADALGVSCDRLMRGVDTPFVDACRQTGLSQKAVNNLKHMQNRCRELRTSTGCRSCMLKDEVKPEHIPYNCDSFYCKYRHVLPVLNEVIEDIDFLASVSERTQSMLSIARNKAKERNETRSNGNASKSKEEKDREKKDKAEKKDIEYGIKFALMESFYAHIISYLRRTKAKGERKKPDELSEKE